VKSGKPATRERAVSAKATKQAKPMKVNGKQNSEQAVRATANHQLPNNRRPSGKPKKLSPFLQKQKDRLVQLRDSMLDSMMGVAKDTLRSRAEGSEASAFGMHQADAGSDAYDRDFALSLLSKEQDGLYEIEEALKRIDLGTYGICEMSNKPIAHARLEAIPFARYTVECQSQLEKQNRHFNIRKPVTSLFGLTDEEPGEGEEEEAAPEANKGE
jgi:RNA polymerase-binding transcription factor DksA